LKKVLQLLLVILMMAISSFSLIAQSIPEDSLYLGQTPPGNTPKIFNLPLTSGHRACERIAITSDGKEIYYGELNTYPPSSYRIRCLKYLDNKWQGPFNVFEGYTAPKLSVNDSIIYMQNNIFYTYYSVRTDSGWCVPNKLLSSNQRIHYFQRTNRNNSFASSYYEGSSTDGNISKVIAVNPDTVLQSLGIPLNSSAQENDFYIAPDESYIFFSRNATGGAGDIYLSYKKENGKWTNPKNLGAPINKPGAFWEYGQFVSNDNKYLFFTSGGSSMSSYYTYWVRIDALLDSLRQTNFIPYLNYQIPNQSIDSSQSFNYEIPDTTFIDDDGNSTLSYSATLSNGNPLPAWLSFDPVTKSFTGTPTASGNINVKVTAKDSANASVSCTFAINVTITGIDDNKGLLPESMNLYQNYPNPFNPTTTIEFGIAETGRYSLSLFNTLGELVKEISDREYEAGYYQETLNATGLSSGMYIYRLTGNDANIVRKMVLLR
jgi:Putative Ig domain/Secretion system C-terminal sorting domain/WD40-like Beta Propeller Repeat